MERGRYHQIDFLRALACVMVVGFHYLYRGPLDNWVPFAGPDWLVAMSRFGYLGVPLFFAISGFVIILSAENAMPRSFAASRIARLYPAFWAAVLLTTLAVHLGDVPGLVVPWTDVLLNFTMLAPWFKAEYVDSAYWSLVVEIHFYCYVWLLLRLGWFKHLRLLMAGWLLLSAVNLARPMFPLEFILDVRWAPFFCLGIGAYLMRRGDRSWQILATMAASSALSVAYSCIQARRLGHPNIEIVGGIVVAIVAVFWLLAYDRLRMRGGAALYWAATLTYPVYLLHEYIGYVTLTALWRAGVPWWLCLPLAFAGVLLLSHLVHRWVEKPLAGRMKRVVAGA